MSTFRLFWKEDCPKCPAAKNIIHQLRVDGYSTMEYNLETTDGLTEAAFYGVLSTPTIILTDKQENLVAEWRGSMPTVEEAKGAVTQGKKT
jgi:thioredoxin-related protein